ncbi:MAG: hypothetical protein AAGI17_03605 [Planctomycetota bacterium]
MLHPAPTTKLPTGVTRGVLAESHDATATRPAFLVLEFYNTDYRIHLQPQGTISAQLGKRIEGIVRADARRVDSVGAGGRYVEPVEGRPRRVQGTVVDTDSSSNTITVNAGVPMVLRLTDQRQRASDFEVGDFITCATMAGATFEQKQS